MEPFSVQLHHPNLPVTEQDRRFAKAKEMQTLYRERLLRARSSRSYVTLFSVVPLWHATTRCVCGIPTMVSPVYIHLDVHDFKQGTVQRGVAWEWVEAVKFTAERVSPAQLRRWGVKTCHGTTML